MARATENGCGSTLALTAEDLANRGGHYLTVIARLKTGVVRLALGATRANILLLVLRKGMKLTLLGVCNRVGVVVCADSFDDFVALRCEGVRSALMTFATVPLLLTLVALVACWILRAAQQSRSEGGVAVRVVALLYEVVHLWRT